MRYDMWLDNDMTNTHGTFGTSQNHDFQMGGCTSQWHKDHKSGECWTAFLRFKGAPSDTMTVSEYYDHLDARCGR